MAALEGRARLATATGSVGLRAAVGSAELGFLVGGAGLRSGATVFAFSAGLLATSLRTAARLTGFFTLVGFGAGFLAGIGHSLKMHEPI